jgi:hypothetical protein
MERLRATEFDGAVGKMTFKDVSNRPDFVAMEKEVLSFW